MKLLKKDGETSKELSNEECIRLRGCERVMCLCIREWRLLSSSRALLKASKLSALH